MRSITRFLITECVSSALNYLLCKKNFSSREVEYRIIRIWTLPGRKFWTLESFLSLNQMYIRTAKCFK